VNLPAHCQCAQHFLRSKTLSAIARNSAHCAGKFTVAKFKVVDDDVTERLRVCVWFRRAVHSDPPEKTARRVEVNHKWVDYANHMYVAWFEYHLNQYTIRKLEC